MRASRPWSTRASARTWSEAVEPPYPGTSSTGPGRSWATGSTGGSLRTTTARATATATTNASTAPPSTSRRRAGESESSTRPVCVGTRHDFVRRRSRVTARDAAYCPDMPTKQSLRPPSEADFTSRLRSAAVTARVGLWLGICFGVCFVDRAGQPLRAEPRPAGAVPADAGLGLPRHPGPARHHRHARRCRCCWSSSGPSTPGCSGGPTAGPAQAGPRRRSSGSPSACWSPRRSSSSPPGCSTAAQWYPWDFSFRATHYALAWVAIGALAVHIAVKLPVIRRAADAPTSTTTSRRPAARATEPGGADRGAACCARRGSPPAVAVLATAGSTVPWLRKVSVFAVRNGDGPQGMPDQQVGRARRSVTDERGRPVVPPRGRARRPRGLAHAARTSGHAAADRDACRSPASRAGARAATWTGVRRARPARPGRRARGPRRRTSTRCSSRGPFRHTVLPAQLRRRRPHPARAGPATASRWPSTTATRAG